MPQYLYYWPGRQGIREKYLTAKGVRSPKSLGTAALADPDIRLGGATDPDIRHGEGRV